MRTPEEKRRTERLRKQAWKLAEANNCSIHIERIDATSNRYYVDGPDEVYSSGDGSAAVSGDDWPCDNRTDPFEGDHIVHDWCEVVERLKDYELDLKFHKAGINSEHAAGLMTAKDPDLLAAWLDNPTDLDRLRVLADWHEEYGDVQLAKACHEATKAR